MDHRRQPQYKVYADGIVRVLPHLPESFTARTLVEYLQTNDTSLQSLEAGWSGEHWEWDAFGQTQRFRSTFSRILPDRSQEFLTARQDFIVDGGWA